MYVQRHTVTVTTNVDGDGTGYTPVIHGRVLGIIYVKTDYDSNPDFDITTEDTAQEIWDEDNVDASTFRNPRQVVHSTVGAVLYYNDESDEEVVGDICVGGERVKIVVDNGGDTKSGTFHVLVG